MGDSPSRITGLWCGGVALEAVLPSSEGGESVSPVLGLVPLRVRAT